MECGWIIDQNVCNDQSISSARVTSMPLCQLYQEAIRIQATLRCKFPRLLMMGDLDSGRMDLDTAARALNMPRASRYCRMKVASTAFQKVSNDIAAGLSKQALRETLARSRQCPAIQSTVHSYTASAHCLACLARWRVVFVLPGNRGPRPDGGAIFSGKARVPLHNAS